MGALTDGIWHMHANYQQVTAAAIPGQVFFIAPYDCIVVAIAETHTVLGTDAGAVSLQIEALTGTQAPGAGTVILGNNSNVGFNLKAAINTPQFATFKAGASRKMRKGNRLAVRPSGVLTAVAGVVVEAFIRRDV